MNWRRLARPAAFGAVAGFGFLLFVDDTFDHFGLWAVAFLCWLVTMSGAGYLWGFHRGATFGKVAGKSEGHMLGFEAGFKLSAFTRTRDRAVNKPDDIDLTGEKVGLQLVMAMAIATLRRHFANTDEPIEMVIVATIGDDKTTILRNVADPTELLALAANDARPETGLLQ